MENKTGKLSVYHALNVMPSVFSFRLCNEHLLRLAFLSIFSLTNQRKNIFDRNDLNKIRFYEKVGIVMV